MGNGARHGLGLVAGLVATVAIAVCASFGADELRQVLNFGLARYDSYYGKELWIGAGLFLVAAVLLGLVLGSRLSPLASLVPGVVYTAIAAAWFASPRWAITHPEAHTFPGDMAQGYTTIGSMGIFFLLGVMLIVGSLAPSRWKARTVTNAGPRYGGPPPAPMGPQHMQGAPAPMGAPQPPAPGQSPSWQGAPQYDSPQYDAPPSQPAASNPPPLPATPPAGESGHEPSGGSGSDDDGPGEWTRIYGGNQPK